MIIVSPYDRLETAISRNNPDRVITIMDNAAKVALDGIPQERHMKIGYTMAEAMKRQACAPHCDTQRIRQMIDFARGNDWSKPLLIHCRLGLSRSPAAAFIIQCALSPNTPERQFAEELRTLSPNVEPSFTMVCQADDLLERGGRMIEAIEAIEDHTMASAGDILRIPYLPEKA